VLAWWIGGTQYNGRGYRPGLARTAKTGGGKLGLVFVGLKVVSLLFAFVFISHLVFHMMFHGAFYSLKKTNLKTL